MTTTRNLSRGVLGPLVRTVKGWLGGADCRPRLAARPRLESLETREVLTGLSAQAALVCHNVANQMAVPMYFQAERIALDYNPAVARAVLKAELSPPSLGNFLTRNGLATLAATPGVTAELARDLVDDLNSIDRMFNPPSPTYFPTLSFTLPPSSAYGAVFGVNGLDGVSGIDQLSPYSPSTEYFALQGLH